MRRFLGTVAKGSTNGVEVLDSGPVDGLASATTAPRNLSMSSLGVGCLAGLKGEWNPRSSARGGKAEGLSASSALDARPAMGREDAGVKGARVSAEDGWNSLDSRLALSWGLEA